jgi:hypothetical protein
MLIICCDCIGTKMQIPYQCEQGFSGGLKPGSQADSGKIRPSSVATVMPGDALAWCVMHCKKAI